MLFHGLKTIKSSQKMNTIKLFSLLFFLTILVGCNKTKTSLNAPNETQTDTLTKHLGLLKLIYLL